ncbi:MAG: hypothetical protein SGI90_09855 [Candidatus Eisenbacteria bacterium]|nr:hypothetical protein [Candidatus Eisenbacteria bacterium]
MTSRAAFLTRSTVLFLGLAAAGCGLFDTRIPDDPSEPPPRHVPSDPDSVLFNFEIGVEYRASGASQLSETLVDSFLMVLDDPDANRLGIEFVPRIDFERANRDFQTLRVGSNRIRMNFNYLPDIVRPLITGDRAFYDNLPYEFVLFNFVGTTEVIVERIAGLTDLTMQRQTNWAMLQWIDIADQDGATETYGYYMGFYSGLSAPRTISK